MINNRSKSTLLLYDGNTKNNNTKPVTTNKNPKNNSMLSESSSTLLILPSSTQLSITPKVTSINSACTKSHGQFNANSTSNLNSAVSSSDNLAFNYYQQKLRKINKAKVATAHHTPSRSNHQMSQSYNSDVVIPIMLSSDLKLPPRPVHNTPHKPSSNNSKHLYSNNSYDSNDSCSSSSPSVSSISIQSNTSNQKSGNTFQVLPLNVSKCEQGGEGGLKQNKDDFYYYTSQMNVSDVSSDDSRRSKADDEEDDGLLGNKKTSKRTVSNNNNNYDSQMRFANEKIMINEKNKNLKFFEIQHNNKNNTKVCSKSNANHNNNNNDFSDYDGDDTNRDSYRNSQKNNIVIIKIDNTNLNKNSKNNNSNSGDFSKVDVSNPHKTSDLVQRSKLANHSTSSLAANNNTSNSTSSVFKKPETQSYFSVINLNTCLSKSNLNEQQQQQQPQHRGLRDSLDGLPSAETKLFSSTRSLAMQTSTTSTTHLSSAKISTFLAPKVNLHASHIEPVHRSVTLASSPPTYQEFESSVKFVPAPVSDMSASYTDKVHSRPPLPASHSSTSIFS
jgi:hypothetical protein